MDFFASITFHPLLWGFGLHGEPWDNDTTVWSLVLGPISFSVSL